MSEVAEAPRVVLPFPHPGQQRVREEARRINVLAAGRRWRKTTHCMSISVQTALDGGTVIWGAPTYDQTYTAWEETARAASHVARFNESRMTASFPGNGRILFRSLDNPDNARSKSADGAVIDEAADVEEAAWREVIRPMLMDTAGWAWIIGTPKGRNWFWKEWTSIEAGDRADSAAWQVPTLGVRITPDGLVREPHPYENPSIPFSELEAMFHDMTELRFRQEILAEFIEDAGGVFRGVMACATGRLRETPHAGNFVMGIDWGKKADYTVLTVLDVAQREVVDWIRINRVEWDLQEERVHYLYGKWTSAGGHVSIVAEENSMGDVLIEQLRRGDRSRGRRPLPVTSFTTTNATKGALIEKLALAIETSRIKYPNIAVLVNELQAYEGRRLASGAMAYSAPSGLHDDTVMSLALALWGATNTSNADPFPETIGFTEFGRGDMF